MGGGKLWGKLWGEIVGYCGEIVGGIVGEIVNYRMVLKKGNMIERLFYNGRWKVLRYFVNGMFVNRE